MSRKAERPRILHLHSTFDAGGKEVRNVRLINAWGKAAEHAIVSGDLDKRSAARLIGRSNTVRCLMAFISSLLPRVDYSILWKRKSST